MCAEMHTSHRRVHPDTSLSSPCVFPLSCLLSCSHKLLLAAGSLDSYISIFAGEKHW
jgi:hypothetical protein